MPRHVTEWTQHECTTGSLRVRQDKLPAAADRPWAADAHATEVDDVDVERPRPAGTDHAAAGLQLEPLRCPQQHGGRKSRLDQQSGIPELRLARQSDRPRSVEA